MTDSGTGTSTNCSAICVAARAARRGRDGQKILGTSITCSGTEMSMCWETAAQEHRGSAPSEGGRLTAPRCAAGSVFWFRDASFVSGPAPLYAEWCRTAANSMRTVIRSCRSHERSRRSLLRLAEPVGCWLLVVCCVVCALRVCNVCVACVVCCVLCVVCCFAPL